jgi:ketosteroid isomerase-like protein
VILEIFGRRRQLGRRLAGRARRWDNEVMTRPIDDGSIAAQIRQAYSTRNLDALAPLLAEDVTWGDPGTPRGCRNRSDVLATFSRLMADGVDGEITELSQGNSGMLCGLAAHWPDGTGKPDRTAFHVYRVQDGLITRIDRFDDRDSAALAAGVS